MTSAEPVIKRLDEGFDAAVGRLEDLLRIPSVSTDPKFKAETRRAADFLARDLESMGFEATVHETGLHPIVTAHHPGPVPDGAPHILYYGHYDVQPPDPLEQWTSPPFEPTIVKSPHGRRLVARGAVDDKGQLMTFIEAFRAWLGVHGTLPVEVTVLLEGEEESGSPSLDPFLEAHAADLAADVCVITDTGMWDIDTPAITYMLRGLVYIDAVLHGPGHDLHSGMYGGAVVNPAFELARIVGELKDREGRVTIPGFYDDVRELSAEEARQWKELPFDEARFLRSAGVATPVGESGRSTLERTWCRPTCEVNGMWGGYTGDGAKTIVPATASVKVSCRLVPEQDAQRVHDALMSFFEQRTPPDCRWTFTSHGCSAAVRVATESPHLEAAMRALEATFKRPAVLIGSGGSIPLVGSLRRILGLDSLLVGFGLEDDRVHSPNEKFELRCFEMGMKSHAAMLAEFAAMGRPAPKVAASKSG